MTTASPVAQPPRARHTTKKPPRAGAPFECRTRRPLGSLLFTLTALLSASCVVGGPPLPDPSDGAGGSAAGTGAAVAPGSGRGSIAISVADVASPSTISGIAPAVNRHFLTIDVTLNDLSTPEAVPVSFTDFTLTTAEGLVITPDAVSALVAVPCPSDLWVAAEARYTCTIAFQVPTDDAPARLAYDDQLGDTATAPVADTL